VLATGGVGQLYQWTTNPFVATGDGIAMAHRVGAQLADLEFMQFHPTALQDVQQKEGRKHSFAPTNLFLLSEALRGEGGVLVDSKGKEFMQEFHPQGDLAPRDVVARAIFSKQKEGTVYLDLRNKSKTFLLKRFPNIYRELQKRGYDLAKDLIPVTPAAHFMCGGIVTDTYGRTSIKSLFAYGEVAATGVHGANRLASNSLLEGFVFSDQIRHCISSLRTSSFLSEAIQSSFVSTSRDCFAITRNDEVRNQIKSIMWQYVGIERTGKNLLYAVQKLTELENEFKGNLEEKNMLQVGLLIAKAAYQRKNSLGTHSISR
jgi:L-aspartate oxidase